MFAHEGLTPIIALHLPVVPRQKRAQAVMAWLTTHGIPTASLTAKGFGQAQPVADNSTEDGRATNRRVELAKQ
jgi:OmpA-OmpF porin, OOP family